jgi:UDP-N-acetylglucosamine diphosphorylase/glucosamine-1-phosphate N-acetyltransferase
MSAPRTCHFEDRAVLDLEPLTLTRPAFDLLCGQTTLAAKQLRVFPTRERGLLVRPHLAEVLRLRTRAVNDLAWLHAGPTVLVNGRWLPASAEPLDVLEQHVGLCDDEVAYAVVERAGLADVTSDTLEEHLQRWKKTLPCRPASGRLVRHLWELVDLNGEEITRDWQSSTELCVPSGCPAVVGPRDRLAIDPTARIDPLVVADTTNGPVVIGRDAVVTAFTRLEGPCCVGPRTQVLGARVRAGTTLGPECRIGGEVEASIVQGHSNKYHDGFLGHAYLGEWVNLGAGTQNSDLRNDYGEVRVMVAGRLVSTGRSKVGCFLGDHTKTGLGALLNTGTSAGVFANLLPCGGYLPRHVPSFAACWNGVLAENADLPALLQTAAKVMRRRGHELTEAHGDLYRALLEQTSAGRRQALREAEARRLRRSA